MDENTICNSELIELIIEFFKDLYKMAFPAILVLFGSYLSFERSRKQEKSLFLRKKKEILYTKIENLYSEIFCFTISLIAAVKNSEFSPDWLKTNKPKIEEGGESIELLIQLYFGKLRDKYKKTQDALKPLTLEFVKAPECNLQKLEDDIDIYERAIKAFKKKIVEYDI